jgi:hypothetical protein
MIWVMSFGVAFADPEYVDRLIDNLLKESLRAAAASEPSEPEVAIDSDVSR